MQSLKLRRLASTLFVLCGLAWPTASRAGVLGYGVGDTAVDFTAYDQNGVAHSLSDYAGKYVFLDFCASWCGPCNVMGDEAMRVINAWSGNPGVGFDYLTVLLEGPAHLPSTQADAAAWAIKHALTEPVLQTGGASGAPAVQYFSASGFDSIPTGVLLDPSRTIFDITAGYQSADQLVAKVAAQAGVAPPPLPPPPPVLQQATLTIDVGGISMSATGHADPGGQYTLVFDSFGPGLSFAQPFAAVLNGFQNPADHLLLGFVDVGTGPLNSNGLGTTFGSIGPDDPVTASLSGLVWSDGLDRKAGLQSQSLSFLSAAGDPSGDFNVPVSIVGDMLTIGPFERSQFAHGAGSYRGFFIDDVQLIRDFSSQPLATAAAVPEPGTAFVWSLGGLAALFACRRRRQASTGSPTSFLQKNSIWPKSGKHL